jgi:hypothetical protein
VVTRRAHSQRRGKPWAVVAAGILCVGVGVALARYPSGSTERVYTVDQLTAQPLGWTVRPSLKGRTVRVRGVLGNFQTFGWPPVLPKGYVAPYALLGEVVHQGLISWTPEFPVMLGPEDPVLALLRQQHVLPPFRPSLMHPGKPRVWTVQLFVPAWYKCSNAPCAFGVVLDTLT